MTRMVHALALVAALVVATMVRAELIDSDDGTGGGLSAMEQTIADLSLGNHQRIELELSSEVQAQLAAVQEAVNELKSLVEGELLSAKNPKGILIGKSADYFKAYDVWVGQLLKQMSHSRNFQIKMYDKTHAEQEITITGSWNSALEDRLKFVLKMATQFMSEVAAPFKPAADSAQLGCPPLQQCEPSQCHKIAQEGESCPMCPQCEKCIQCLECEACSKSEPQ